MRYWFLAILFFSTIIFILLVFEKDEANDFIFISTNHKNTERQIDEKGSNINYIDEKSNEKNSSSISNLKFLTESLGWLKKLDVKKYGSIKISDLKNIKKIDLTLYNLRDEHEDLKYLKSLTGLKVLLGPPITSTDPRMLKTKNGMIAEDDAILHIPYIPSLEKISLYGSLITNEALQNMERYNALKELWLGATKINNGGMRHLEHLKELEVIDVSMTDVDDEGLKCLERFNNLKELYLTKTNVTGLCFSGLKNSKLNVLKASNAMLEDKNLKHLSEIYSLKKIFIGDAFEPNISDSGIYYLKNLTNITDLNLYGLNITNKSAEIVKQMRFLTFLDLSYTKIDNFNGFGELSNISVLKLVGTKVSDDDIKYLKKLTSLKKLSISETRITDDGMQRLRDSLPNCLVK